MRKLGISLDQWVSYEEENYDSIIWKDDPKCTKEQWEKAKADLAQEYDAQEYARNRQAEYPSVQECVHAILDDTLDALQAKRAEIKTKYPKGG